jgi:hypothetical protein
MTGRHDVAASEPSAGLHAGRTRLTGIPRDSGQDPAAVAAKLRVVEMRWPRSWAVGIIDRPPPAHVHPSALDFKLP